MEPIELSAAIVEWANDAIIAKSLDGKIIEWNPAAARLFGYSREEAMGQHISTIVPENHQSEIQQVVDRVAKGERIEHFRTVNVTKDGHKLDVSLSISPIRDESGNVIGAAKIVRDITHQRMRDESARLVVENAPTGILLVDSQGIIQMTNPTVARLFGYEEGELIGQPVDRLVPTALRDGHAQFRSTYTAKPERRSMGAGRDLYAFRKDGTEFPVEIGLDFIRTSQGVLVLAIIVDITERKKAADKLMAQTRELQRSNEELSNFAYVASHDLQEPLRMVASYTELLAEQYEGQLDERADKFINYAVEGAKRMHRLVNDLLAYSRLNSIQVTPAAVDADVVLHHVLDAMQPTIEQSHATVEVPQKLPGVIADESRLAQVFQNLIGNALKFRGSQNPQITIRAKSVENEVVISVQDNGIGIASEFRDRVFKMFQRLHTREKYEGNGMGLAIVKKIVESWGGRIWVESTPDNGSTFLFALQSAGEGESR